MSKTSSFTLQQMLILTCHAGKDRSILIVLLCITCHITEGTNVWHEVSTLTLPLKKLAKFVPIWNPVLMKS